METEVQARLSPSQMLLMGFVFMIALGTALLMLPYSTHRGISFIDALFTATSAVCVTGLIVKNTPQDFTLFGQMVILGLIQVGGLGYMSMSTMVALLAGRKIGLFERMMIKESLNITSMEGVVRFIKRMLFFVFTAEALGTVCLLSVFGPHFGPQRGLLLSLFHSVSAFNNAGFSLFSDSLMQYRGSFTVNLTIMGLIILGGIGFVVFDDIFEWLKNRRRHLMQHTKIVLTSTVFLIIFGALVIYLNERNFLFKSMPLKETLLSSFFGSVTARTAGFNTIDYSRLQPQTLFFTILLMIIGASPGSTGGGIKTTTFTVILMHLWSTLRGRKDTVIFKRRVPELLISRALVIMALSVVYITVVTFVVENIEHSGFLSTMFEVVSAFGTVGLSVGNGGSESLVATFTSLSKMIIIITMLVGRLGPLTLFTALLRQEEERIRYPEGRLMIG
ncbi:MAG: potassium transporter [Nitrospirae bacterium]|nr:MAG: potassium transporter [Nitrospirota bacterium]